MAKEPFMLVSLKEDKAKKLAQVIGNPTCIKILDYLAEKEATETQIATELNIPLSTVHYNLSQLVDAKLVLTEEFHYSEKGREVNHYKLANKYIIIAPKDEDDSFVQRLRKFLPVTILTLGTAVVLKTMQFLTPAATVAAPEPFAAIAPPAADVASDVAANTMMKTAGAAPEAARMMAVAVDNATQNVTENVTTMFAPAPQTFAPAVHVPWWQSPLVDWFLLGAVFVLVVLLVSELISYWRWKRQS